MTTSTLLDLQQEALVALALGCTFWARSPGKCWREVSAITYAGNVYWAGRGDREGYAFAVTSPRKARAL